MVKPANQRQTLGTFTIDIDGQSVSYAVKRSARAKHIRLEVRPDNGLTVVIPAFCSLRDVPDLLKKKKSWILSKLERYERVRTAEKKELKDGDFIPYMGRNLRIVLQHSSGPYSSITPTQDRLIIKHNSGNGTINSIIESWYRHLAEQFLKDRIKELGKQTGLTCNRVTVRSAKTRWGSCSQKGNINLNWKLILLPKPVIDYVIIHELSHLKEMNHSKKFWEQVAEFCPKWREHRQWLKDHADKLFPDYVVK